MKRQWKGFFAGMLAAMLLSTLVTPTLAALVTKTIEVYTGVNIYIDDKLLQPTDANGNPVEAFVYNGTTYLPIRAVGNALGVPVQWEGKTTSAYLGKHTGEKPAVWLKDLDYFTGSPFHVESTDKDNLGQSRTNCITGIHRSNGSDSNGWRNTYRINGQYSLITGTLYQRYDYRSDKSNGYLKIYGDGELLYEANMNTGIDPIDFSVDIRGVLELEVHFYASDGQGLGAGSSRVGTALADCGLWT